ncbi:MAG: sensor domain-containing diguanylate cyclase, partial [Anaerolineaceae bacterium]|nr:sensor domain-containing diguanylate cyclase [Anaerolineaceae bacterium]
QGYEERGILSYAQSFRFPVDQIDNLRQMAETGKPMAIPDTHQHPGWVSFPEIEYIRSFSGAPINIKGRVVGFINLDSATANFFNQTHAERLMAFAHQAAIAIENAQLHTQVQQMAVMDFLTGTYNRRGFSELSEREMERARRFKRPLALLFLDIDHFKRVNDQYGHMIGDQALQQISLRLVQNLRSIDLFSRFGGEEFAILLPDTDNAAARLTAERLRLSIEAEPIPTERAPLDLTVSIGVASLEDETPDLRTLIEKADQALYQAKQGGRNRVV